MHKKTRPEPGCVPVERDAEEGEVDTDNRRVTVPGQFDVLITCEPLVSHQGYSPYSFNSRYNSVQATHIAANDKNSIIV